MKGSYHVTVSNRNLKYEFDIIRNFTLIQGNSATGKTTLVDMIREYAADAENSGVQVSCERPLAVLEGNLWKEQLDALQNTIIFIDEVSRFVESEEFASAAKGNSNYFVIVTRANLDMLPISVNEVYGIRSSGRYMSLQPVYHEFYRLYGEKASPAQPVRPEALITEDSNSGFEFFKAIAEEKGLPCVSACGKSNIFNLIAETAVTKETVIIADGAAFAPQMNRILALAERNPLLHLYLPESFEWLVLDADVLNDPEISAALKNPANYIESEKHMSWERFFTALLTEKTAGTYLEYSKRKLNGQYLRPDVKEKIMRTVKGMVFG